MILVRFKHTFRERLPEWACAFALVGWGLIVLSEPSDLFSREYFSALAKLGSQTFWGFGAVLIGMFRIVSLAINGAWRPTAHFRAIGAFVACLLWSSVIVSYLSLDWSPPALATKSTILVLDMFALWFAAGDAKLADLRAHNKVL